MRYVFDPETRSLVEAAIFYANQPRPERSDFATPMISGDYEGYDCPVTGKWVEGRAAHRENLKRTGCRLLEKGESRDAEKRRRESLNAAIDRTLEQE